MSSTAARDLPGTNMNERAAKRSPLRFGPLRVPGQSVADEIEDVVYDGLLAPMLLSLFIVILAGLEWWRYAMNLKPTPWIFTMGAACVIAYTAIRYRLTIKRLRNLKLGRDGERAVAQYLEWFRTADFFVLHDVPSDGANIDHVLIGPRGVYTIETKTISKPSRGECKVRVAEQRVYVNGQAMDRDPLIQAKAQAGWLADFFGQGQLKSVVQPVVVFPGWFVEPFDMKRAGVWVLEPKQLDYYIQREPERYSREHVKALGLALSSYVRSQARV